MKSKAIKNYIFFTSVFFFLIMLLIVGLQKHTDNSFSTDVTMTYNEGWLQIMPDGTSNKVELPGNLSYDSNNEIVLQRDLPEHVMSGLSICMWASKQSVLAQVEGNTIYSYGVKDSYVFGKNSGSFWNIIRIPESAHGQTLTITLKTPYKNSFCYMDQVYIGTQTSLLFTLLADNGIGLLLSFLMLLAGVILAICYFVFRKHLAEETVVRALYLSMFTVLLGLFIFAQSRTAQFFFGNSFAISLIYYMGVMLLPVPMLFYLSQIKGNRMRKGLLIFSYICILDFLVCTVLQFANILDFSETAIATRIVLFCVMVVTFINAVLEYFIYKNDSFRYAFVGLSALIFFGVAEVANDFLRPGATVGNLARYGAVFLVIMLFVEAANEVIKTVEASRSAAYYERLATIDLMANCYSRTAYNQDIEDLARGSLKDLGVVYFDLNYLKLINDTYGHAAGDQAIKTCSVCIRKVFDSVGKVYRLGGDEFAVIIKNCDEYRLLQRLAVFQRLYMSQNKRLKFEFRIASGYAIYDPAKDQDMDALVHRADAAMYNKKKNMKSKNSIADPRS